MAHTQAITSLTCLTHNMACRWAIREVSLITWHTDKPLLVSHSQTCQLKQVKAIETWTYVNMCEIRGWHKLISEAAMKPVHNMDHTTTPGNWLVTNWQQQHSITQLILIWLSKNTYSFLSTFRLSNRTQKITRILKLYQALTSCNFLKHIPKLTIFGTHNLQTMHHTLINKLLHIMQFFLFNIRPKLHHLKWRKLCVTLPVNMAPFSKEEKIVINFISSLLMLFFVQPLPRNSVTNCQAFRTDFTDLNLYWIKGALLCFSFWLRVLD